MIRYEAKLAEDASWWEKLILNFKPFLVHQGDCGFVIYKEFRNCLYVYVNGHHQDKEEWNGGAKEPWNN